MNAYLIQLFEWQSGSLRTLDSLSFSWIKGTWIACDDFILGNSKLYLLIALYDYITELRHSFLSSIPLYYDPDRGADFGDIIELFS